MKRLINILASVVLVIGLSSCAMTVPHSVTENAIGSKTGVSKTGVVLGLFHTNSGYGVPEAAKNGKINGPISTVDVKKTRYTFLYRTEEMIVTGE